MIRISTVICLALAVGPCDFAQCRVPRYQTGRDYSGPEQGAMWLSVKPSDFTLDKIGCLAQKLKTSHPNWKMASVFIFTSRDAAREFMPHQECDTKECGRWPSQLYAMYGFELGKQEEGVSILPLGFNTPQSLVADFHLPVNGTPHCRLEMRDRCVVSLEKPAYLEEALKARAAGKVALRGTIARDGKITGIRVEDADGNASKEAKLLVSAARQNLSTWQLEARPREDSIRIVYSYAILGDSGRKGQVGVEFELPTQVVIRGN